jgi:hypothetical protein
MKRLATAACSVVWVAIAAYEAAHASAGLAWEGYAPFNGPVPWMLVPLWLACAWIVWSERGMLRLLAPVGAFTAIVHGVVVRLGGDSIGIVYVAAGALLGSVIFGSDWIAGAVSARSEASR